MTRLDKVSLEETKPKVSNREKMNVVTNRNILNDNKKIDIKKI